MNDHRNDIETGYIDEVLQRLGDETPTKFIDVTKSPALENVTYFRCYQRLISLAAHNKVEIMRKDGRVYYVTKSGK